MKRVSKMQKKAFVLSIVLWIVVAMLFGTVTLAMLSKDTLTLTSNIKSKLQTQLMALDTLEFLKFHILTASRDNNSYINNSLKNSSYPFPNKLIADNRWYKINKNIKLRIQDTSALLDVIHPPSKIIATLATTKSQRQERFVITDSIKDWVDKDNVVKLNGAESSRYEHSYGSSYKIRNSPAIQSPEELRLIRGIKELKEQEWEELRKRLYYGGYSSVNLTLIDSKYLAQTLNISQSQAEAYTQERETDLKKFIKVIGDNKHFNDDDMGFHLSRQLNIEIVTTKGDAKSILKTLIDFKKVKDRLYTTYFYKLN